LPLCVIIYSVIMTLLFFYLLRCHPPISTLFPYTTLFRSHRLDEKILPLSSDPRDVIAASQVRVMADVAAILAYQSLPTLYARRIDRKSTRLNSSHEWISYAVFCLKKKKKNNKINSNPIKT